MSFLKNGLELVAINLAVLVKVVQSQWVQMETIPDQVLAVSSDGSTAIALTGIYRKSGTSWTLLQQIPFSSTPVFLLSDGSSFAIRSLDFTLCPNIDVYKAISSTFWNVTSSINSCNLGLDLDDIFSPSASTSDGRILIATGSNVEYSGSDFYVLVNNGLEYVLKQQLIGLPYDLPFQVSISADGSILAFLWTSISCQDSPHSTPVTILALGSDGTYVIVEEHNSFWNWSHLAISANGKTLVGTSCPSSTLVSQAHFFSWIDGHFQYISALNLAYIESPSLNLAPGVPLCISSDASIIFTSVDPGNMDYVFSIVILKQSGQTTWSVVQTLTDPQADGNFGYPIFCSADGSTFLSSAVANPVSPVTYVYTGPLPTPQVSFTPTTSATATSSASSTASATASISASLISSMSSTPSPSVGGSSSSNSSTSSSAFSPIANIAISVTSTALIIVLFAVSIIWFRRYFRKRSQLYVAAEYSNNKTDPLLRVN